jgi:type I restriction enzyme S subunit
MTPPRKEGIYKLPLTQFPDDCDWPGLSLATTAEVLGGGTPDTGVVEYWEPAEIPWATPTDITGTEGNEIVRTERSISNAGLKQSTLIPENSVLMTSRATIGAAKINREPMAINQGFAAFVPKPGYSTEYLFHLIEILKPTLVRLGAGTTFLETSRREIKKVLARVPVEDEQRRIAAALKLADDAIAKAKAELEATRELKRSLLRSLFVEGLSHPQGLHRSKWITCPAHWTIKPLRHFAKITSGFTMGRDLSRHETVTVPYVTVVNVQDGRFELNNISSIEIKNEELNTDLLQYGDILMTEGGDRDKLGRGGMWREAIAPCSYQNHIFRVRLDIDEYKPELFHFLIRPIRPRTISMPTPSKRAIFAPSIRGN